MDKDPFVEDDEEEESIENNLNQPIIKDKLNLTFMNEIDEIMSNNKPGKKQTMKKSLRKKFANQKSSITKSNNKVAFQISNEEKTIIENDRKTLDHFPKDLTNSIIFSKYKQELHKKW